MRAWYGRPVTAYNPSVKARFEAMLPPESDPAVAAARLRDGLAGRRYRVFTDAEKATLRADRGSRFAPIPESLRREVRIVFETGGVRIAGSVAGLSARNETLAGQTRAFRDEIAGLLSGAPERAGARPDTRIPAWIALTACIAVSATAFLVLGRDLIVADLDAIRAGRLAWEFFPATEPLNDLPASLSWIAAGFLAGTAGLVAGSVLGLLFRLGSSIRPLAEIFGGTLAWISVFLVTALVAGPPALGGGVGFARSMLDIPGLLAVALVPWGAWFLLRGAPGARSDAPPYRSRLLFAAALVGSAAALLFSERMPSEAPVEGARAEIAREYLHHAFRDRWLLTNPFGEYLNALYYRYTPYAGLMTGATIHPERLSLRLMAEGGTLLWLAMPLTLIVVAVARGTDKLIPRRFPAARGAALAALLSAGLSWPLLSPAGAGPESWKTAWTGGSSGARAAAAHAAALWALPGDAPMLRSGLQDPDARVRLWCVSALAHLGDWESFPEIARRLADDPHFLVRSRAADAMWLFAVLALTAPDGKLADAARELDAPETDPIPRRRLADAAASRLARAAAREEFAYIRRRLLVAETAWEIVRSR